MLRKPVAGTPSTGDKLLEGIGDTRWVASQFWTSKIRVQAAASSGQMGRKIKGAARFFLCPHVLIRIPYPDHPNILLIFPELHGGGSCKKSNS